MTHRINLQKKNEGNNYLPPSSYVSTQDGDSYYPFPSKVYAHLANSLRPVVKGDYALYSTKQSDSLNYVCWLCKDIDPFAPGISAIKAIKLPGYCEPSKV